MEKRKLEISIEGKPVDLDLFDKVLSCFSKELTVERVRETLRMLR
jgi:hypothetical protein